MQALLALWVSLCLQIAVNYSNDYSDGIRGTDDNRIGPVRLTASGLAPAESVKRAAILSFAAASIAGIALAALSSWWVILLGVAAIAAAWGYTGGKNPYGYKGLGEMDAEQLRETTMDPEKRTLRRITIKDGVHAEKIFELLMGNEVAPRRDFIGTNQIDLERIDL